MATYNELKAIAKEMKISYVGIKKTMLEDTLKEACGDKYEKLLKKHSAEKVSEKEPEKAADIMMKKAKEKKVTAMADKKQVAKGEKRKELEAKHAGNKDKLVFVAKEINEVFCYDEDQMLSVDGAEEDLEKEVKEAYEEAELTDFGVNAPKGTKTFSDKCVRFMQDLGMEIPEEALAYIKERGAKKKEKKEKRYDRTSAMFDFLMSTTKEFTKEEALAGATDIYFKKNGDSKGGTYFDNAFRFIPATLIKLNILMINENRKYILVENFKKNMKKEG